MKKIRMCLVAITTTLVIFLSPMSFAQAPFPALTVDNATSQNPFLMQCGSTHLNIPVADPAHIHWSVFIFAFLGFSGTCQIFVTNPQLDLLANVGIAIAFDSSQGEVSSVNIVNQKASITFKQGSVGVMAPNIEIQVSGV